MSLHAPDAAGLDSAGEELSLRNRPDAIPALFSRWRQRLWLILGCLAVCMIAAGIYLATATPIYQVTSLVMVERTRPVAKTDLPPDEFLAAQKSLLLSLPGAKEQSLDIVTDKGEGTITISTESEHPQTAAITLTNLTNAYLQAAGGQQSSVAQKLTDLAAERDKRAADRTAKATALDNFKKQNNITGTETDAVVAGRRDQLASALTAAQAEAAAAKANADAAANLPTDPAKLVAILNVARNAGVFTNLENERAQTQDQLTQLETQLAKQRETLGAQHPLILQTQKKMDALTAHLNDLKKQYPDVYRAYCTQQLTAATNKVNELKVLLDQQTQRTLASIVRPANTSPA